MVKLFPSYIRSISALHMVKLFPPYIRPISALHKADFLSGIYIEIWPLGSNSVRLMKRHEFDRLTKDVNLAALYGYGCLRCER